MKTYLYKTLASVVAISIASQAIAGELVDQVAPNEDVTALHQLWERYQQAVAKKDAKGLLALYVSDAVPVMGGIAPQSYALIVAANKRPVPRTLLLTARENVAGEVKLPPDEIKNIRIHSDGEVGSIAFDYAAKVGHGHIIWSTVRTNDGWKIAFVLYSINVPAADKKGAG